MMINNDFLKFAALLFCQSAFITLSHAQVDLKPASGSALAASPHSSSSASLAPAAVTSRVVEGAVIEPKVIPLLESPAITTFTVPDELVAKPISESEMASKIAPMRAFDAGSLWDRLRGGFKMADLNTPLAQEKTTWYARQPEYIGRMTERGSQYLYYIVEELERRNMPSELALLPFVESAFNPQAVSSAKAAGMWQFMPATGKHFNLKHPSSAGLFAKAAWNVWRLAFGTGGVQLGRGLGAAGNEQKPQPRAGHAVHRFEYAKRNPALRAQVSSNQKYYSKPASVWH
jgi:Transglycosylase SLT domain